MLNLGMSPLWKKIKREGMGGLRFMINVPSSIVEEGALVEIRGIMFTIPTRGGGNLPPIGSWFIHLILGLRPTLKS